MIDWLSVDILVFTGTEVTTDWVVFFWGEVLTVCFAGLIAAGAFFTGAADFTVAAGLVLVDLTAFGAGFFAAVFLGAGFFAAAAGRLAVFDFPAGFFFAAAAVFFTILEAEALPTVFFLPDAGLRTAFFAGLPAPRVTFFFAVFFLAAIIHSPLVRSPHLYQKGLMLANVISSS
ncbi:MAG: hypothetical protein EPO31_04390 [Gammaproteobacteria bacterium]|nr:MAG: hypothetical protein EPO31_04390 [Gammaproteobacteria bacterium]